VSYVLQPLAGPLPGDAQLLAAELNLPDHPPTLGLMTKRTAAARSLNPRRPRDTEAPQEERGRVEASTEAVLVFLVDGLLKSLFDSTFIIKSVRFCDLVGDISGDDPERRRSGLPRLRSSTSRWSPLRLVPCYNLKVLSPPLSPSMHRNQGTKSKL